MYKVFYLNNDYKLDYKGSCLFKDTLVETPSAEIEIPVYGKVTKINRFEMGLFTHFRMNPFIVDPGNVKFIPVKSKVMRFTCGHIPIFATPVVIGHGFRIIPGFSNFAIDEGGNVLSFKTGNILNEDISPYGYPAVSIYDPDKELWRVVNKHILLARAFLPNDDPERKIFINHKDGNKLNLSLDNLEWCTSQENVIHAVLSGLRNDCTECSIHDLLTGETKDYPSFSSALRAHGVTSNWCGKTRLVNGQEYPRVYAKRFIVSNKGQMPTLLMGMNAPGSRTPNIGPYQSLELKTGIVVDCETLQELAMMSSVPYDHVRAIISSAVPKKSNGYYFRIKTDEKWPNQFEELVTLKRRSFVVKNKDTSEEHHFHTVSDLVRFLSVDKRTVYNVLKNKKEFRQFVIEEIVNQNLT